MTIQLQLKPEIEARLFRQSVTMKQTSLNHWKNAINEIHHSDAVKQQERKTKIKNLFESML